MNSENELRPLMLSTQELLMAYWPQVEPLLATCPAAEEYPPEDIRKAVLAGQMFVFVFYKDTDVGPTVELVLVLAPAPSTALPTITLMAVAGKGLKAIAGRFWEYVKGWCFMNGARAIDAYVPERMEEFMQKELGLKRETVHVRLRL